ncbi:ankyrin repeat domain-containing protein [Endozoicomonas sp. YOMI1]|uniref:ankyrin repeat domain-containing protein n=1 Tax=Endozoicomonas sp. YOMI1 TaxID=2828739 RepID=UPI002148FEC1|nr:ankyrin repeat domain-containing protein [Endozoicomonas sp. YOMI1]
MDNGIGNLPIGSSASISATNTMDDKVNVPSATRFSLVEASRWVVSATYNFMYNQLSVLGRKIARTEPVAGMLIKHYVGKKDTDNVRWMIENGMNFDKRHKQLAYLASTNRDHETLNLLLHNKAPADALMEAYVQGRPKALKLLIDKYGLVLGKEHFQLVITAARRGDVESLNTLLSTGVPAFDQNVNGDSPLLTAIKQGHIDAVKLLIKFGAPVTDGSHGFIPIVLLKAAEAKNNSVEIVQVILDQNPFSMYSHHLLFPEDKDELVEQKYSPNALLATTINVLLDVDCDDHIVCLLLRELSDTRYIESIDAERCQALYEKGIEKGVFRSIDQYVPDNRIRLKAAVAQANYELEWSRTSLRTLAKEAFKRAANRQRFNATTFNEVAILVDRLDIPEELKDELKRVLLSPAVNPRLASE